MWILTCAVISPGACSQCARGDRALAGLDLEIFVHGWLWAFVPLTCWTEQRRPDVAVLFSHSFRAEAASASPLARLPLPLLCALRACVCVCLPHQHAHTHTRIYHYNLGRISRARWGTGRILRGWREGPNFSEPWSAELCKARNAVNSTFGVTSRGPGLNQ